MAWQILEICCRWKEPVPYFLQRFVVAAWITRAAGPWLRAGAALRPQGADDVELRHVAEARAVRRGRHQRAGAPRAGGLRVCPTPASCSTDARSVLGTK